MNEVIEIFLERGHITKEAAERLEQFEEMSKEAFSGRDLGNKALEMLAGVGAAVGGYHLMKKLDRHNMELARQAQDEKFRADAQKSLTILKANDEMFKKHPDKAIERFNEVLAIAPVLAGNPTLSSKIVKKFLHSGIDFEGVQGLSSLQESRAQYADLSRPISYKEEAKEMMQEVGQEVKRFADEGLTPYAEHNYKTAAYNLADAYTIVKEADFKEHLMDILKGVGVAAGIGLAGAAGNKAIGMYQEHKLKGKLDSSWAMTLNKLKAMTSTGGRYAQGQDYHNPDVQNQAREAFHTLSVIAPALAVNPTTASTFVNRAVQNESQIDPELLKTISEIQKNVSQAGKQEEGPFTKALEVGGHFRPRVERYPEIKEYNGTPGKPAGVKWTN